MAPNPRRKMIASPGATRILCQIFMKVFPLWETIGASLAPLLNGLPADGPPALHRFVNAAADDEHLLGALAVHLLGLHLLVHGVHEGEVLPEGGLGLGEFHPLTNVFLAIAIAQLDHVL